MSQLSSFIFFKCLVRQSCNKANLHHYITVCCQSPLCISSSVVTFIWPWLAAGSLFSGSPLSQIDQMKALLFKGVHTSLPPQAISLMASQQPCHHRVSRTKWAEIQGPQDQVSGGMDNSSPHWCPLGIEAPGNEFVLAGVEICQSGHGIPVKMTRNFSLICSSAGGQ